MKIWLVVAIVVAIDISLVTPQTATDMKNLLTQLFTTQSYNFDVRPQTDQSTATDIFLDFFLFGITGFDPVEQKLTTTAYLEIIWTDEMLTWTPSSYGGIEEIKIPQSNIWLPDIALHNGFQDLSGLGSKFIKVKVFSDGTVIWTPFHVFESTCKLDSTYYPFEKQVCSIDFIAWTSDNDDLHLVLGNEGIVLEGESSNGQWKLVDSVSYSFSDSGESKVRFMLMIQRKPLFFIINIIFPIVLLSFLNIFTFQIPTDIGERLGYTVTVWLSFAVFLTIISASLPQSSDTLPILSVYIIVQIFIGTIGVLMSTWEARVVQYGDDIPVNRLLKKLSEWKKKIDNCHCCKKRNTVALVKAKNDIDNDNDCNKNTHDSVKDKTQDITWKEGVTALDFFSFWTFLTILIVSTIVLFLVSTIGGMYSVTEADLKLEI